MRYYHYEYFIGYLVLFSWKSYVLTVLLIISCYTGSIFNVMNYILIYLLKIAVKVTYAHFSDENNKGFTE